MPGVDVDMSLKLSMVRRPELAATVLLILIGPEVELYKFTSDT